jgi:predicted RNase H-like nuclease (RuvC/YqgF family)
MKSGPSNSAPKDDVNRVPDDRKVKMLSMRGIFASLLAVFLIIALGMTGGQVRELGNRVTSLEEERSIFQRRLEDFKEDNLRLLSRIRDYQDVLEIAQQSNISLSKRLLNRDLAVEDLQRSIDVILDEKYANEQKLNEEIGRLQQIKRDLIARGAALGEAVAAQDREIEQLEQSYRMTSMNLARATSDNERLSIENERYKEMLFELEEKFVSVEKENRGLVKSFDQLQDRTVRLEAQKMELKEELRGWIDSEVSRPGEGDEEVPGEIDFSHAAGDPEHPIAVKNPASQTRVANADGPDE